jgi:uncharacterized membrane protein
MLMFEKFSLTAMHMVVAFTVIYGRRIGGVWRSGGGARTDL